jgi:hypothetical protein
LPGSPDRPVPGPGNLIVRAVFVPEGEQVPPDFTTEFEPLHFPATLNTETGEITCTNAGPDLNGGVLAQWYPDTQQEAGDEDEPDGQAPDTSNDATSSDT